MKGSKSNLVQIPVFDGLLWTLRVSFWFMSFFFQSHPKFLSSDLLPILVPAYFALELPPLNRLNLPFLFKKGIFLTFSGLESKEPLWQSKVKSAATLHLPGTGFGLDNHCWWILKKDVDFFHWQTQVRGACGSDPCVPSLMSLNIFVACKEVHCGVNDTM